MSRPSPSSILTLFVRFILSHCVFLYHFFLRDHDTQQSKIALKAPSASTTTLYEKLSFKSPLSLDYHASYWWRSSGYALSVLLDKAGYSNQAQYELLTFFRAIAPSLGAAREGGKPLSWKSFMTDDHTPIELSWDWRTGGKSPKIRFSIEPVGIAAGTQLDPSNRYAPPRFRETMAELVPGTNMGWLGHFQKELSGKEASSGGAVEGHASKEFYAFDLGEKTVVSKAYFFPGYKARATNRSNLDVISDAIATAPGSTPENTRALRVFRQFASDPMRPFLEMDMLAIDLIDPAESRFKIYFRVRDTSFASFRDTMTLGNRITSPEMTRGLKDMKRLYQRLFGVSEGSDDAAQLPDTQHRTAGFLYFVEFKYGSKMPKVKAYLPVRHYAQSEEAIISALEEHLETTDSPARANVVNYKSAMRTIFSRDALRARSGLHTYLGCSVEEAGELRLVSYINPRQLKFASGV